MDEVGAVQGGQQRAEGMLHGGLLVEGVRVGAHRGPHGQAVVVVQVGECRVGQPPLRRAVQEGGTEHIHRHHGHPGDDRRAPGAQLVEDDPAQRLGVCLHHTARQGDGPAGPEDGARRVSDRHAPLGAQEELVHGAEGVLERGGRLGVVDEERLLPQCFRAPGDGGRHIDDRRQIVTAGRGEKDRLGRVLDHRPEAFDVHRVGGGFVREGERGDEVDLRAVVRHAGSVGDILHARGPQLTRGQVIRSDEIRAQAEVDLPPLQTHRLDALTVVHRDARRRAADALLHEPARHQDDIVILDPAPGGLQHLQSLCVHHPYTDVLQDVQGRQVDLPDLLIGEQPVARDALGFEAAVHWFTPCACVSALTRSTAAPALGAYPSAPISSANSLLTGAPPMSTFT